MTFRPATLTRGLRQRWSGRGTIQRIVGNSSWLFLDQAVRMGMGLSVGVWVARYLGPAKYGELSYALALVAIAGSFTSLGLNAVVIKDLAQNMASAPRVLGSAWRLRLGGATVAFLVCCALASHRLSVSSLAGSSRLIPIVALVLILQTVDVVDLLFQAQGQARVSAWIRMLACISANLFRIGLIYTGGGLVGFAWAGVVEIAGCAAGWLIGATARQTNLGQWSWDGMEARRMLAASWPLAIASVAVYAQAYIDQIFIGSMLGPEPLGQYAAAMRMVTALAFIPSIVQVAAAPEIARAKRDDEELYWRRLYNLYRVMVLLFILLLIPLALIGPKLILSLYGSSYAGTAALLPWMAIRLLFANFGLARSIFLNNENLLRFALVTAILGVLMNLSLNFVLIPKWGTRGAIVSSFISLGATTFGFEVFKPKARENLMLMLRAMLQPWRSFQSN